MNNKIKILSAFIFYSTALLPLAASAKDITLGSSLSIPPYIIKEDDSGIQLKIIREALAYKGHSIKEMTYASYRRLEKIVKKRQIDAVAFSSSGLPNTYPSEVVINYINHAISLKSSNLTINSYDDLLEHPVLAFQNAKLYLSSAYKNMAKKHKNYQEVIQQIKQINQLYKKRTRVLIMDKRIFQYFRQNSQLDTSAPVNYHDILAKNPQRVFFIDRQLRDDFNEGLQHLRSTGRLKALRSIE